MERTHGVTHWDPDGCFGCRIQTTQFAPSAMPSRRGGAHALSANATEKQWAKDMPVFKELRKKGYNPRRIDGVADLANRVETGLEIERGRSFVDDAKATQSYQRGDVGAMQDVSRGAPEFRRRAMEAHEHLQETGWKNTGNGKEPMKP